MIKRIVYSLIFCLMCPFIMAQEKDTQHYVQAQKTTQSVVVLVVCGSNKDFLEKMGKIIKKDLEFTEQFSVQEYYQEEYFTSANFVFYQGQGPFLVTLNMSRNDEGAIQWRLYKYNKKGEGQFIKGEESVISKTMDWWSHAIADELYKQLTGNPSPFLSKIAYCKQLPSDIKGNRICFANYNGTSEKLVVPFTPLPSLHDKNKKEKPQLIKPFTTYLSPCWARDPHNPTLLYSEYTPVNLRLMSTDFINPPAIVTDFDGLNMLPAYSSDGKEALLCLSVEGKTDIYRYVPGKKGGKAEYRRISKNNGINVSPAFLNDTSIAFCSDYELNVPHIYIMNKNGDNTVRISKTGAGKGAATSPAYCPIGNKVAYVQLINGILQLMVYDVATGTTVQLSFDYYHKENPSWSPCGNYIICGMHNSMSKKLGCFKLLTSTWQFINPTASEMPISKMDEASYSFPTWSPAFLPDTY